VSATAARIGLGILFLASSACGSRPAAPPAPDPAPPDPASVAPRRVVAETVTVRDPELERRVARLELQVWERDAQIEDLENRLTEARGEVVRAMEKLQTLATRAEAASGMAEADVAIQGLQSLGPQTPEFRQATQLMEGSTAQFNKQNFGGALYMANQAKGIAAQGRRRLAAGERGNLRQGEVFFALPISLRTTSRGNVRDGPATTFRVVFTADAGTALTGVSYLGDWVRVIDDESRSGWISRSLIDRRSGSAR
jgi:uncharacterized coiled-coil protein SlyX